MREWVRRVAYLTRGSVLMAFQNRILLASNLANYTPSVGPLAVNRAQTGWNLFQG